ncbi:unnamed protein product [Phytomonas sp. Hart1]|nr:unnamed protein product [Phytomonas sp. Hart1]|eukprot:CCW69355.1 unnamed protein product [Phytomonas sp. isolate Hart1]
MFGQLNNPSKGKNKRHGSKVNATRNNNMGDIRYQGTRGSFMDHPWGSMRNMYDMHNNNVYMTVPPIQNYANFPEMLNHNFFMHDVPCNNVFNTDTAKKVYASRHDQNLVQSSTNFPVRFSSYGMDCFTDFHGGYGSSMGCVEYMFDGFSEDIISENLKDSITPNELTLSKSEIQNESRISNDSIFIGRDDDTSKEFPSPDNKAISLSILAPPSETLLAEESVPAQPVVCVKPSRTSCRRSSRPYSRTQTIDCVEFPKGEEMTDELTVGHLGDQVKQAFEMVRQVQSRERGPSKEPTTQDGSSTKGNPQATIDSWGSPNRDGYSANSEQEKREIAELNDSRRERGPQEDEVNNNRAPSGSVVTPTTDRTEWGTNHVRTLVVVESMTKGNQAITCKDSQVSYNGQMLNATEIQKRKEGSLEYGSQALQQLCEVASRGFNVALLSSEAPNTSSRFTSPVWKALTLIVRKVLADHTDDEGHMEPDFEFSCALGYILNDKCKDIFTEEDTPFEKTTIKTSPIFGANLQELQYFRITDAAAFEEHLSLCLARSNANFILSGLMEGFVGAFLNMRQGLRMKSGEKDICLSSIIVTSAGSDVKPYTDSLNRVHNIYGSIFHLAVLGPCFMCYMLNIADDDTIKQSIVPPGSSISAELEKLFSLLKQMSGTENLPLRSGSVRRFLAYVKQNSEKTKERLNTEDLMEDKRTRLKKFLVETNTLMEMYTEILTGSEKNSN